MVNSEYLVIYQTYAVQMDFFWVDAKLRGHAAYNVILILSFFSR